MGRSNRLRATDVRDALRLVGDCRDVGGDRRAWVVQAADGFRRLARAPVVIATVQPPGGYVGMAAAGERHDSGWDECGANRQLFLAASGSPTLEAQAPDFVAFRALAAERPNLSARRRRLLTDAEWHRTAFYADYRRPGGMDDYVHSEALSPGGALSSAFQVCRPVGDRGFTGREVRLTHLFHQELARLVGKVLAVGPDPRAGLSPRLRQTLDRLLIGESEKQAAGRLGLSVPTVHQYVGELYRRFGVHSRAELLAALLRHPRPPVD